MAHIKERIAILMALAVFSLSFLCCRKLDSFPAVYVGANSVRANIVLTAMYYAGDDTMYVVHVILNYFRILSHAQCFRNYAPSEISSSIAFCCML